MSIDSNDGGADRRKAPKVQDHALAGPVSPYFLAARFDSPGGAFPNPKRVPGLNLVTEAATAYAGYVVRQGAGLPVTDSVLFKKVRVTYNLLNTH